jgi:RHS repeat-associated protein
MVLSMNANSTNGELRFFGITGQRLATYSFSYGQDEHLVWGFNFALKHREHKTLGMLTEWGGSRVTTDRLGSLRADWDGAAGRYTYYPYGEVRTAPAGQTGLYADLEDPVRVYDSNAARFTTPDPLGLKAVRLGNPGSWNRYAYAGGDPINFIDPDGLSPCSTGGLVYNGVLLGSVSDALNDFGTDVTDLAETEYTESGHGSGVNSTAEEDMIGEVIMNRWALVNGYWYLYPNAGRPPQDVSTWGTPGGGIASIVQAKNQFDVWRGNSLSDSAQANLDHALNSDFGSKECNDLAWAIGSAISFLSQTAVNLYYDPKTNLAPLSFNSGNLTIPSYMGKIGSFGDANVFYGAPVGDFSANLLPLPRPRPIRPTPPGGGGRRPGRRGGPMMVW